MEQVEFTNVDMPSDMQTEAAVLAYIGFKTYTDPSRVADFIKEHFDTRHGKHWQCVIGNFALSVTHSKNKYIEFNHQEETIVLFKTPPYKE